MDERYLRRTVGDEEVVVDLEAGEFFSLNETAARILALWREGETDADAIAARLSTEYAVGAEAARAAVRQVLDEARAAGLLGR